MPIFEEKAQIVQFPKFLDERGNLSVVESQKQVPFRFRRCYWIYDVPGGELRGSHAFKNQHEVIVALSGSFDAVIHDGKEYLVTAISDDAFKGNTSLTKVTIPESIGHIGNNAFAGCIGLQIIYCYATEPIALGSEKVTVRTRAVSGEMPTSTVFAEVNKESCILYVPKKCGEKYRNADGWCEFQNILEMVSDILGDANNDGNLDQKDIDAVIHYIMTGDTNNFIFDNANVNGDNKVDIADIVLLVNIIRHTQP